MRKTIWQRVTATLLCGALLFLLALPAGATVHSDIRWGRTNSIIAEVITEQSRSFSVEDFPEVDCLAVVVGEKKTDEVGIHYFLILVLQHSGDEAVQNAIEKVATNPLVTHARENNGNDYELWDYQIFLNQYNGTLRLGETLDIYVADFHSPVFPGVVQCIQFTVDRNYIDDSEENIVEIFAKYGIEYFWIDEIYNKGSSWLENTRSEQGLYFAALDPQKTSYEMLAPLADSDAFKDIKLCVDAYTGGYTFSQTWRVNYEDLASLSVATNHIDKKIATVKALKPGEVIVTVEHGWYGDNPTQDCVITILDEYMPGDADGDLYITAVDALEVLKHVVGKIQLGEKLLSSADITNDGFIDTEDALRILQKVVGK
ncbi:MAG: dockerin type I repeat-containing protein [Clostridia bacterium]|nr:dockerin type I repeat-containing protein [Clostridia bacterium]